MMMYKPHEIKSIINQCFTIHELLKVAEILKYLYIYEGLEPYHYASMCKMMYAKIDQL